jgi:SAM-dependent methyltransferase
VTAYARASSTFAFGYGGQVASPEAARHPHSSARDAIELHQIAGIFDARAARYAHDDWHRRYAEQFVAVTPVRPGNRVLDAGTGTGFAACAVARRIGARGRVLAVDVSAGMLEQARAAITTSQLSNVDLFQGDATAMTHLTDASLDAVVCAAGLLYMPVAEALREWARLLRPGGVVAFSTMRTGSPSAGRLFRECAATFGLELKDPSEALGTPARCREVLEDAGFTRVDVTPDRVDFESLDPTLAWEANSRAMDVQRSLSPEQLQALRERYLGALSRAMQEDLAASARAEVLYAVARRSG